jgi:hypothetical protein
VLIHGCDCRFVSFDCFHTDPPPLKTVCFRRKQLRSHFAETFVDKMFTTRLTLANLTGLTGHDPKDTSVQRGTYICFDWSFDCIRSGSSVQ